MRNTADIDRARTSALEHGATDSPLILAAIHLVLNDAETAAKVGALIPLFETPMQKLANDARERSEDEPGH